MRQKLKLSYTLALLIIISCCPINYLLADEGMWPMYSPDKTIIEKMKLMGAQLEAEMLYNEHDASLKDAVVVFDNTCTGVFVSRNGLLFTNHHCAIGRVQQLSNLQNNILANGFWAHSPDTEIPISGLTIRVLQKTIDVTAIALKLLSQNYSTRRMMSEIEKEYNKKGFTCTTTANPDGKYLLSVYKQYSDIRLVGIPAEAIANFGGQHDNFEWPRHSADFAVFRVYANAQNEPSAFAASNIAYTPKKHLSISTKGILPNDFVLTIGFPGITQRNIHAMKLREEIEIKNKATIIAKTKSLDLLSKAMSENSAVKLMYSNKYFQQANSLKLAMGVNQNIKQTSIFEQKIEHERILTNQNNQHDSISHFIAILQSKYQERYDTKFAHAMLTATLFADAALFGIRSRHLVEQLQRKTVENLPKAVENLSKWHRSFMENYHPDTDKQIVKQMIKTLKENVSPAYLPAFYNEIDKKFKSNIDHYVDYMFDKSIYFNISKFESFLEKPNLTIKKDPLYQYGVAVYEKMIQLKNLSSDSTAELRNAEKNYQIALRNAGLNTSYPDANSGMRFTYGRCVGFSPRDAVIFGAQTTHTGILEKVQSQPQIYQLPIPFKNALERRVFGKYAKNDLLYTCFLSDTDITGGNSGSPVLNRYGQLVGLAFDGNFESLPGMFVYEANKNRAINVDIRYILFIIDIFENARYIMNELTLD